MATVPVANCKHWQAAVLVPNACRAAVSAAEPIKWRFTETPYNPASGNACSTGE